MVENGNKAKPAKRGSGKCCCAVSTLIIIIALGVVTFVFREWIVEEVINFGGEGDFDENYETDFNETDDDYEDYSYKNLTETYRTTSHYVNEEHTMRLYPIPLTTTTENYEDEVTEEVTPPQVNEYEGSDGDSPWKNVLVNSFNRTMYIKILSDIYKAFPNTTEDDVDDRINILNTTSAPVTEPAYEGSGSSDDGYTKSKTIKTILTDDEDYHDVESSADI